MEAKAEGNPPASQAWLMPELLLAERCQLQVHRETRTMPVYVLSASKGAMTLPNAKEGECTDPPSTGRKALSTILDRTVVDQTGASGRFDVDLPLAFDSYTSGIPNPRGPGAAAADPELPSISVALAKQLGIKLDSGKGPVEVLVIDRVERPAEN